MAVRGTQILLVDDHPTNLKVLSDALQGQGWLTLVATDGELAIEQAEYAQPDLILLDIMMPPGIDGFETCRQLKANPATQAIPIIFMSALSDPVDKVQGLQLGAVDYITKPFQQEEVIARVKLHLQLASLTQTLEQKNVLLQEKIAEQAETSQKLQQLTHELEQQVNQRTQELAQSLKDLKQAQLQLIQHEKMSTLGQLVAGIGHEINNPVNFLTGNISLMDEYIQDFIALIQLYQDQYPEPNPVIIERMDEMCWEEVIEDLPKMLRSMEDGIHRLEKISLSLRTLGRSDTVYKSDLQIHDGLDSTLILLKHRLQTNDFRPMIQVYKKYANLPSIRCYPGQLNQAFMNILANAIDALDERSQMLSRDELATNPNLLQITTEMHQPEACIAIRIADNGVGIPPEIQDQVFETSFTTKPVGKGTGLGLAISYQIIVDKHGGTLTCQSTPGEGTEFVITLPL